MTNLMKSDRLLVYHTKDCIEELNQRALSITSTSVLSPGALAIPFIIEDAPRQMIVQASCYKWSDLVIEYLGITPFVHSLEETSDLAQTFDEELQAGNHHFRVVDINRLKRRQHCRYDRSCPGLHCVRDHEKP
jgi:hypothetical protein